jgi:hypothetical protein
MILPVSYQSFVSQGCLLDSDVPITFASRFRSVSPDSFLGQFGVFSGGLESEGCLSNLCVECGGPIAFDLRPGVSL